MIYMIVAMDTKQGIANEKGIPWQGKIPGDVKHFRQETLNKNILMGYKTYQEFNNPLPDRVNYVATNSTDSLKPGFVAVKDARQFLLNSKQDVWVIGGAGLFDSTIDLADQLHLTRVEGDFKCTKFFPEFKGRFHKISNSQNYIEDDIPYMFEVWKRNA